MERQAWYEAIASGSVLHRGRDTVYENEERFSASGEWERGTGVRSRKHISRTHPSPGARCTRNDRNSPRRTCDPEVSLLATIYCHDTKRAPPLVCCSHSLSLSLSCESRKMIRERIFRFIFPIFETIFVFFVSIEKCKVWGFSEILFIRIVRARNKVYEISIHRFFETWGEFFKASE